MDKRRVVTYKEEIVLGGICHDFDEAIKEIYGIRDRIIGDLKQKGFTDFTSRIEHQGGYDWGENVVIVSGSRLETDDEMNMRIQNEKAALQKIRDKKREKIAKLEKELEGLG